MEGKYVFKYSLKISEKVKLYQQKQLLILAVERLYYWFLSIVSKIGCFGKRF